MPIKQETIIEMIETDEHRRAFGIMFESARLFTLNGRHGYRFAVWDNTGRPNKLGQGDWVGPDGRATNERATVRLTARSVVISAHVTGTELAHSAAPLHTGQTVRLAYPGRETSQPYTIE